MINNLPDKLKQQRRLHHYSQKQVADALHLSPSIVSGYETGERTPSLPALIELSELYHCTTDFLLGKSDDLEHPAIDVSHLTIQQQIAVQNLIDTLRVKS